jgi:excisionase family DNA binding protein
MRKMSIAQRRLESDQVIDFTRAELRAQWRRGTSVRNRYPPVQSLRKQKAKPVQTAKVLSFPMTSEHAGAFDSFLQSGESQRTLATLSREQGLFILRVEAPAKQQSKELLSCRKAARMLGVSRVTIYRWVREGRLRAYRLGRMLRFDPWDVMESLSRCGDRKQSRVAGG